MAIPSRNVDASKTTARTPAVPIQGTLALDWSQGPVVDQPGPRLMSVDFNTDPAVSIVPTSREELPEPRRWTAQLVQAVVEVLAHERPRQQLVRWLSPSIYADLSASVLARAQPSKGAPNRARRSVSSVHIFEPADGIIEASAVVVGGARARAVALRLEGWDGRWRCTRLAIL